MADIEDRTISLEALKPTGGPLKLKMVPFGNKIDYAVWPPMTNLEADVLFQGMESLVVHAEGSLGVFRPEFKAVKKITKCDKLRAELTYLHEVELPFRRLLINTYKQARNDPAIWKYLNTEEAQQWVLDQVRKKYKDAKVSGRAYEDDFGDVATENINDSPFAFLRDVTTEHETFHTTHHIPHTDDMRRSLNCPEALPCPEFVRWFLGNEIEALETVNIKKVTERTRELEKQINDCEAMEALP